MALRGAVTRLLSNSQKCAAVTVSRAQGTAATAVKGTFQILYSFFKHMKLILRLLEWLFLEKSVL